MDDLKATCTFAIAEDMLTGYQRPYPREIPANVEIACVWFCIVTLMRRSSPPTLPAPLVPQSPPHLEIGSPRFPFLDYFFYIEPSLGQFALFLTVIECRH